MSFLSKLKSAFGASGRTTPPSVRQVAGRAYALNAIIVYAKTISGSNILPSQISKMDAQQAKSIIETSKSIASKVVNAAKQFGFLQFFSPVEAKFLTTHF